MLRQIPYGISNYKELIEENRYFVDKTRYIALLEEIKNPIFLRPKRFGKSLFCSMLSYYYDLNHATLFETLFQRTWIGQSPTDKHNQYIVLSLDFSGIEAGESLDEIEYNFKAYCNAILDLLRYEYRSHLADMPKINATDPVATNLSKILHYIRAHRLPPIYIIIDEYDSFANQLIISYQDRLYDELTADDGFFKTFFKAVKEGRKIGAIANIFVTGVLPIAMDDLASAFNIGSYMTLDPLLEAMLGFTQSEVDDLLDQIYQEYALEPSTRAEVNAVVKNHYNGYHFASHDQEALYNSTILMYFLSKFTQQRAIPKRLTDLNLKTDISWVKRLTASNPKKTTAFVDQLTLHNQIEYDDVFLVEKFNMSQFFDAGFFPISFFYLGMLTKQNDFYLRLPNLNMRQIFVEYFNEIHHIDVSTEYAEFMQQFVNQPDLETLFAGYWERYVAQLPKAIFQQVNENFYRTTFFELCSRYLSRWFTWNVERSYPAGKSDLEFVGKFDEKFAGLRWLIEFKYLSNTEFSRMNIGMDKFQLQEIYCIGNQGFRVFEVD